MLDATLARHVRLCAWLAISQPSCFQSILHSALIFILLRHPGSCFWPSEGAEKAGRTRVYWLGYCTEAAASCPTEHAQWSPHGHPRHAQPAFADNASVHEEHAQTDCACAGATPNIYYQAITLEELRADPLYAGLPASPTLRSPSDYRSVTPKSAPGMVPCTITEESDNTAGCAGTCGRTARCGVHCTEACSRAARSMPHSAFTSPGQPASWAYPRASWATAAC